MIRKVFIGVFLMVLLILIVVFWGYPVFQKILLNNHQISIDQYCGNNKSCPQEYCEVSCVGGSSTGGCALGCVRKECYKYNSSLCPNEYCQVMKTSASNNVCDIKLKDNRECGKEGYYGQKVDCCKGFVRRTGELLSNGKCDYTKGGYQNKYPYCLACGNGECSALENKCNCPEDCR